MKKFPCLLLFLLPLFSFISDPASIMCGMKKGVFMLDNIKLSPVWLLKDATDHLGQPDRSTNGYNNTYTYDKYGIVLFESTFSGAASGKIKELQVYLAQPDSDGVSPKNIFKGQFMIEKNAITSSDNADDIKSKMKGWNVATTYRAHSYKFAKDGTYLFFIFSDDEKTLRRISAGLNTVN